MVKQWGAQRPRKTMVIVAPLRSKDLKTKAHFFRIRQGPKTDKGTKNESTKLQPVCFGGILKVRELRSAQQKHRSKPRLPPKSLQPKTWGVTEGRGGRAALGSEDGAKTPRQRHSRARPLRGRQWGVPFHLFSPKKRENGLPHMEFQGSTPSPNSILKGDPRDPCHQELGANRVGHTVDGCEIHFAPPEKQGNPDSLVNNYQPQMASYGFKVVQDFVHPQY